MRKFFGLYSVALVGMLVVSVSSFGEQLQPDDHGKKRDISRPTANPILEGTVIIQRGERKTTKTGHTFTRIGAGELKKLGVTDTTKFGEAWAEPDSKDGKKGMIWGDIVKKEDGTPRFMNHKDAIAYCKSIGAELPSGWQSSQNKSNGGQNSDFVRLREYMGATLGSHDGYTPQVLPNLTYLEGGRTLSRYFWSSSVHGVYPDYAYGYLGRYGYIDYVYRDRGDDDDVSTRCVSSR